VDTYLTGQPLTSYTQFLQTIDIQSESDKIFQVQWSKCETTTLHCGGGCLEYYHLRGGGQEGGKGPGVTGQEGGVAGGI
jgi:hypothetical protein